MGAASRPLGDLLEGIDGLDENATIYISDGPVDEMTRALALKEQDLKPSGYRYLLEVFTAKEVLEVWSTWRAGRTPSRTERCAAIAHYASHDAYLPTENSGQDP